ncbi:GNAT family N-acetyltransferase [Acholeplasma equirhinis]|uniref:GNAT family N-acetyltransferase n=1 Tax=Acholeplasma equirhinis TaxID=555393 RepID=UPI00197A924E|nr:GNAT family N-acetyltransferase [Acholeplasma equirhinis]MBN3490141.1 GNAT family N-acetyltransferase [Acholeplasma equirhinis]
MAENLSNFKLETERLILRDFIESDFDFYQSLETNPYAITYERDTVPDLNELLENFKQILELQASTTRVKYSLLVVDKNTLKPVGRVVMWQTNVDINEWEIGWMIKKEFSSMGYATEAAKSLEDYAFSILKIHRLQALCHEKNYSSEKVMIKLGMIKEGQLRSVRKLNGKWNNMLIYSKLNCDL